MNGAWLAKSVALSLVTTICADAADWPQWRGPARTGHAAPTEKLAETLPSELTPLWKSSIGTGFSSPVIAGDKLFFVDGVGTDEVAHCVNAKTGVEIWKASFSPIYSDEWGTGSRGTPVIDGSKAYAMSCTGELRCFDLADGKVLWAASFEKDFGVKFLGSKAREGTAARRGNNGSLLLDGNLLFVPVGSKAGASMVAFDKATGQVVWKNGSDEAAYSSPIMAEFAGVKQVVALTADSLTGFRPEDGKILWTTPVVTGAKRNAMTPVVVGDNIVINTYTGGMTSYLIAKSGDNFTVTESWKNKDTKINLATPVLIGGFLYSYGPNKNYVCIDAASGKVAWTQNGFGENYASTTAIGDKLVVLTEAGEMIVLKANPGKYEEVARAQVCGKNWNAPAWADGRLYVRDNRELAAYAIGASTR
jgi:outer membrane protein assembly factor BamB